MGFVIGWMTFVTALTAFLDVIAIKHVSVKMDTSATSILVVVQRDVKLITLDWVAR